jgi:hypothetical protein
MSAQGGTLQRRGTIELPIWPVAVLVVAAVATAIGMTTLSDAGQTKFVTSVTNSERFENSSAAVREQGAVAPTIDLTNSGVAIRDRALAIPEAYTGFENPGAYITRAPAYTPGLENPGAYPSELGAPGESNVMKGEPCMQCRW